MSVVVTGAASVVLRDGEPCDPSAFLKVRKSRKFMGLQDDLAVTAVGRAIEACGLGAPLGERAGLFCAIGFIPFRREDIDPVYDASVSDGRFDVRAFGAGGYGRAHPLLTFRCLPNMPAYHVSANFGIEGPYAVYYPGASQLYAALGEAVALLEEDAIDVAILAAACDQQNFLVRHHFTRIVPPVAADSLANVGAALVLERDERARARGATARAALVSLESTYEPPDVLAPAPAASHESWTAPDGRVTEAHETLGPAHLLVALAGAGSGIYRHALAARDGTRAQSVWSMDARLP